MKRFRGLLLLSLMFLGGCAGWLPTSGPSTKQMEEASVSSPNETLISLIEVDASANQRLQVVEKRQQFAQVFFDVLMRESPDQQAPSTVREVWHFMRPVQGGSWKLDGIQQVE